MLNFPSDCANDVVSEVLRSIKAKVVEFDGRLGGSLIFTVENKPFIFVLNRIDEGIKSLALWYAYRVEEDRYTLTSTGRAIPIQACEFWKEFPKETSEGSAQRRRMLERFLCAFENGDLIKNHPMP